MNDSLITPLNRATTAQGQYLPSGRFRDVRFRAMSSRQHLNGQHVFNKYTIINIAL